MHKRPEDGMWLPTGGQLKTVTYVYPPRHKEYNKKKNKKNESEDFPLGHLHLQRVVQNRFDALEYTHLTYMYRYVKLSMINATLYDAYTVK